MDENMMARDLMKTGLYEYVEPNFMAYPTFTPNDALLGTQWSHTNSSATEAWDICRGNNGIIITLTDTGIHVTHQDITGANRVSGANSAVATNTSNVKLESILGIAIVKDLHGHGTHVTGIAAANSNNGVGIAGVNIDGTRHRMVRVSVKRHFSIPL